MNKPDTGSALKELSVWWENWKAAQEVQCRRSCDGGNSGHSGDPREGERLQNEEGDKESFPRRRQGRMTGMLGLREVEWIPGTAPAKMRRHEAALS